MRNSEWDLNWYKSKKKINSILKLRNISKELNFNKNCMHFIFNYCIAFVEYCVILYKEVLKSLTMVAIIRMRQT